MTLLSPPRLAALGLALLAILPLQAAPPAEYAQPQTVAKPAPAGLKLVDQGTLNPALKGYMLPEGFKVEIVASEPTIINPVAITFSSDGTLYLLEWLPSPGDEWKEKPETFTYKDGSKRNVATMWKKTKDVLKICKYNAETKTYDKADLILEDDLPSSILVHDGWVYLSGRGSIRRHKQSKPGGAYDVKEVVAQGFCGFHHHQVSGMTIGLDGWLYITSGDDDNFPEGSDGSRATVLRTGAVFRCKPDGSKMETYSIGWRNPYRDLAFDNKFNWFHTDNDNEDGSKFTGCRIMHVVDGADYGWRLFQGARCCRPDPVRGAVYGEMPGKLPPMVKTGRGSPAGLLIYNDTRLPEFYRGWLYYPDVFRKSIRAYKVEKNGSSFDIVQEFEFMKSDDPLFRPCQMVTGPDGAVYICDWRADSGGAGKLWGDGKHGRLYRLTWNGGPIPGSSDVVPAIAPRPMDSWAKVIAKPDAELLGAFEAPDMSDRMAALSEVRKRGEKNRDALIALLKDEAKSFDARALALGALQSIWTRDVETVVMARLGDKSADMRRLAADALALNATQGDKDVHAALIEKLSDPDISVRRSVLLALARVAAPGAEDVPAAALKFDDGKDRFFSDAILRAAERIGKPAIRKLLDVADSGVDAERDKVVAAFLGMRERVAADALPQLLVNPHLSSAQRVELVKSYTNYLLEPAISYDPLFDLLTKKEANPDVAVSVLEVLADSGALKGPKATALAVSVLDSDKAEARLAALKAIEASRLAETAPRLIKALAEDKRDPAEAAAILKALRTLADKSAALAVKAVVEGQHPVALRVEALRTLTLLDGPSAMAAAKGFLDQPEPTLQAEAVTTLAGTVDGAKLIGERFAAKKLARDLLPQVSEALRRHIPKNPALTPLLTEVMKGGLLVSLDAAEVERVRKLVAAKGDPARGKVVFLNTKALACMTCHKMEGVGGQVGPDLTRVWDTMSVEKLLESILEPSKEIKEGYQSYSVVTKAGATASGLKISDKPAEVIIRDSNGKDQRFGRDEIDEVNPSKVSLMPQDAVAQLSYEQFIDLIAFLKSQGSQETLRGSVTEAKIAGPFPGEHQPVAGPEKDSSPTATYDNGKIAWRALSAEPNGYFNLASAFTGPRRAVYLRATVNAANAGKGKLFIGVDGSARVWVNGQQVADRDRPLPQPALPDQQAVEVELKQGENVILIKSVSKPDGHGAFLRVEVPKP